MFISMRVVNIIFLTNLNYFNSHISLLNTSLINNLVRYYTISCESTLVSLSHSACDIINVFINFLEIQLKILAQQAECTHVQVCCLAYEYEQDIFADLLLPHEVLIVHDTHLEVLAVTQFLQLALEICVEFVHAPSQTIQEIV